MNKLDSLRKIIDECDFTMKEAFVRRMDASDQIAQLKIDEGLKIYDVNREKFVINNVTAGATKQHSKYISTLWKTILRMSRCKQYDIFIENGTAVPLLENALDELPVGDFCCGSAIPAINRSHYPFLGEHIPVQSEEDVYKSILSGECTYGIIKIQHINDTEKLYGKIVDYDLYVNQMILLESGQVLVIISKNLIIDPQNSITTIIFHFPNRSGELAKYLAAIADRNINIAFLRLSYEENSNKNIVTVDLEGSLVEKSTLAAVLQLSDLAPFFRVIGARKAI